MEQKSYWDANHGIGQSLRILTGSPAPVRIVFQPAFAPVLYTDKQTRHDGIYVEKCSWRTVTAVFWRYCTRLQADGDPIGSLSPITALGLKRGPVTRRVLLMDA